MLCSAFLIFFWYFLTCYCREADDERGRARGNAGMPAKKNAKKWTPPPWDERPLRKSDKKSQGVTNPYASKPTKARVTRR